VACVSIGDIHLQSDKPWSIKVAQEVIKSILESPLNVPENTLVFLGDLTEKASIDGMVYSMLMSLFTGLKYKDVYILVGNHDGYLNKANKPVLVYDFLRGKALKEKLFNNFHIISKPEEITIEGMDFLFLPHIFNDSRKSLKDYERLDNFGIDVAKQYTAVFGHFTNSFTKLPGETINVEYIHSKYWTFGHQHNPNEYYQGSYIPNSIAEAGQKRQIRVYENGEQTVLDAPYIMDYFAVKFPEPIVPSLAKIPIYTVYNCKDEEVAKDQYGDIFIRRAIFDISLDDESFEKLSLALAGEDGGAISIENMFDEFLVATKLTDDLKEKAKLYLKNGLKKEVA
jgi:calcineurin-like phosphoesterase family protein